MNMLAIRAWYRRTFCKEPPYRAFGWGINLRVVLGGMSGEAATAAVNRNAKAWRKNWESGYTIGEMWAAEGQVL